MNMSSNWYRGIKGKLLLMVLIPTIVLSVISYVEYYGLSKVARELYNADRERSPKIHAIGDMDASTNSIFRWLWASYQNEENIEDRVKTLEKAKIEIERFEANKYMFEKFSLSDA